jgi:LPXTG-site transpeptidase (sortase) family protein
MKKNGYMQVLLPLLFIIGGISYLLWTHFSDSQMLAQTTQPLSTVASVLQPASPASQPRLIQIPRLQRTLIVQNGIYNPKQQTWTLDNQHAFFIAEAHTPLVYGHATPSVFGSLHNLQPGDELLVDSDSGRQAFFLADSRVIAPEDVSILQEKHDRSILLMTCNGLFSETREVFRFTEKIDR